MATEPFENHPDPAHERARAARLHFAPAESRALGTIAILATLAILWVMLPVGLGVLLGTLLAFTAYPFYRSVARRTHKPALAATIVTAGATLLVAASVVITVYLLVLRGVAVFNALPQSLAPGGAIDALIRKLQPSLHALGFEPNAIVDRLRDAAGSIAASIAGWATRIASAMFDGLVALLFMVMTMYFVLRRWKQLGKRAEHMIPINPRHTRRLLREVRRLGRVVVIGNFGTALIQGVVAGTGFAIARVPQAAFLGAMTAVTSLLPVVGTMIVWVPAAVLLFAGGHPGAGAFVLAWNALAVIAFCDYVVRPKLVGGGDSMSGWLTFVGLFGGIKLFGFVGVLLGPMIVGVATSALHLYERARRFRLNLN